jgi:hypothetical protein
MKEDDEGIRFHTLLAAAALFCAAAFLFMVAVLGRGDAGGGGQGEGQGQGVQGAMTLWWHTDSGLRRFCLSYSGRERQEEEGLARLQQQ